MSLGGGGIKNGLAGPWGFLKSSDGFGCCLGCDINGGGIAVLLLCGMVPREDGSDS